MNYNINFQVAAVIIIALLLYHFLTQKKLHNANVKTFTYILVLSGLYTLSDLLGTLTIMNYTAEDEGTVMGILTGIYLLDILIPYILYSCIPDSRENEKKSGALSVICAGITVAMMIASEYLNNSRGGKGIVLGGISGITPAEIVILGAGTLGEFAARTALGLGATVKIFDHSVERLRKLNEVLGQRVFTSVFHKPVLDKALASADVLIGAMRCFDNGENTVVSEAQVRLMKRGAVIVDMSIDHGGCIETAGPTTHEKPVYTYEGVIHYCVPNVLSRVARTASIAYSNVFLPMLQHIARQGGFTNAIRMDAGLREGVYLYNGILTKNVIADKLGLIARDINLLIAAL